MHDQISHYVGICITEKILLTCFFSIVPYKSDLYHPYHSRKYNEEKEMNSNDP